MEFDHLRTFCQLAEDGNYRVAADYLNITQSALTKKIQRLEMHTGAALFERGRHGASLTQAGQTLLPEAQRVVANFNAYQALSGLVADGTKGFLNIGFGISSYQLAPQFIARFKNTFPNVHITLNDTPSQHQLKALLRGELQISFNRLPVSKPLKGMVLASDHLVVAIHRSRKVAKSGIWHALQHHDYLRLTPSRGLGLAHQIDALLQEHGQSLTPVQEANDIHTLLALVSADLGFTIVPASVKHIANSNVRFIPLQGMNARWDIGLIWNDHIESPTKDQFVSFIARLEEGS